MASINDTVSGKIVWVCGSNPYLVRVIGHRTLSAMSTIATAWTVWRTAITIFHNLSRVFRADSRSPVSAAVVTWEDIVPLM